MWTWRSAAALARTSGATLVVVMVVVTALTLACSDGSTRRTRDPDTAAPACGDSKLDEGEECDGSDLGPNSCTSLGFDLGTLSCSPECKLVTAACTRLCGDGALGPGEECDGTAGPLACADFGYKTCTAECRVDALHCRTVAFVAGTPVTLAPGGPALLTDLAPEQRGDLVTAVAGRARLETHAWDLTRGFVEGLKLSRFDSQVPIWPLAADVDGDGHQDLASINADGSADRYRYTGTGFQVEHLSTPAMGADGGVEQCAAGRWLGAGKLDGDGADDLVALGCSGSSILVYPGGAQPAPPRRVEVGATVAAAALVDADGDGLLDVLAATGAAKLLVLRAPDLTVEGPLELPGTPVLLAAADLDQDGDADVVLGSGGNLLVLENTGAGFAQRRTEVAPATHLLAADLDLDGLADFAWFEPGKVKLRRNLGQFTFTAWEVSAGGDGALSFSAGDLEGDGDLDLAATVAGAGGASTTYVLQNKVR